MKRLAYLILLLSAATLNAFAAGAQWKESKSTHFIIYYKSAGEDFISQVAERSEVYYDSIAEELGFRRFDFWLWDNRARIYIYDDAKDFMAGTGQPEWAMGDAVPRDKVIRAFPGAHKFLDTTLPHEMGHIIFREFVGFNNPAVPLWLDEGVASYHQKFKYQGVDRILKSAAAQNKLMRVADLSAFASTRFMDKEVARLFYAESFSIVDFLLKNYGKDSFVLFCQNLRDKKDLKRALASAYSLDGLQELDAAWSKDVLR